MIFIVKDCVEQLHLIYCPRHCEIANKSFACIYCCCYFIEIALSLIGIIFHTTFFHHHKNLWIENMLVPWCVLFSYM